MKTGVRDRPMEVLPTGEARRCLHMLTREFDEHGADADPVFFGAFRKPSGVLLAYELYIQMLDHLDELEMALQIRKRDAVDDGTRLTLDEVLAEHGFDRDELEEQLAAREEADRASKA